MTQSRRFDAEDLQRTPTWWRLLIIAAGVLVLCSCRGPRVRPVSNAAPAGRSVPAGPIAGLPSPAKTISNSDGIPVVALRPQLPPHVPRAATGIQQVAHNHPISPHQGFVPGCAGCGPAGVIPPRPWPVEQVPSPRPSDEYLCDGGDLGVSAVVSPDWTIHGLGIEDTIGHFDTLDGDVRVVPSNKVCVYAPRFAAVRKVTGAAQNVNREKATGAHLPTQLAGQDYRQVASTTLQQIQPTGQFGMKSPSIFRDRDQGLIVRNSKTVRGMENLFAPYEDFRVIRYGVMLNSEKARLTEGIDAAIAWESKQPTQVLVDNKEAAAQIGLAKPQEELIYKRVPGNPKMRVIKVASTDSAQPGEIVEFTLRFDNTGDEKIGNVTLVDNLTTRLEYVPDSAQCDLKAHFYVEENEAESLVLRWEIIDPLEPGEGGIIRFKCRVR